LSVLKSNLPITSREYKLLLKTENFNDRLRGAETFWSVLESAVDELDGQCFRANEDFKRVTWFLDTPEDMLLKLGYILRIRDEKEEEKRFKITMKFRHPDRYIASSIILDCTEKTRSKFEEDILHPFTSKFSQSVTFRKKDMPRIAKVTDILDIFPKLHLSGVHTGSPVVIRSDFKAYEISHRLGTIDFGDEQRIKCCLNFWYKTGDYTGTPVVTEFSFDYDANSEEMLLENYPQNIVQKCYKFYGILQKKTDWFDSNSATKTALISEFK